MTASLSFWKNLMASDRNLLSRATQVALLMLLAGNVYLTAQSPTGAPSAQPGRWKVLYQAGSAPFAVGSRVQITIGTDQLIFAGKKGRQFSIPATTITALSSSLTSEHTVTRNQVAAWGGLAQLSPYTLIFLPFGLPVMAATYPIKSKYAYISILWSETGADQEVQFRLDRKDYESFVTQLRTSTGKEWKNLESEWERLRQALATGTGHQTPLLLDRKVRMGKVDIKPGSCQLIVLTEAPNQGQVYVFPNNGVNIEHLLSTSQVEIAPSEGGQVEGVTYKQDDNGVSRISEIRTLGQLLRFP